MRTGLPTVTALVIAASVAAPPAANAAPPDNPGAGRIAVTPGDPRGRYEPPTVDVDVTAPGEDRSPHPPLGPASGNGTGAACTFEPAPRWEAFIRGIPGSRPNPGQPGIGGADRIDPRARLFARICNAVMDFVWVGPGENPDGVASVLPGPGVLARRAAAQLVLPLPVPRRSPNLRLTGGGSAVVVGEHTWIWVDPGAWRPQRKRVQVGGVWAEATAIPVRLAFTPGDGNAAVTCAGPGTPYTRSAGVHATSPTCDYVYPRSSAGMAGGAVTATYAIGWRVTWRGAAGAAPAGGVLPDMASRARATFAVAEAQGLITR